MSDMVVSRVNKTIQLMSAIKKLKNPQSEMLLLRNCVGVSRLYFAMRTTNHASLQQASNLFDDHLFKYLRLLITGDGAGFGPLKQRLDSLPIKDGGLGIYTMSDTRTYCYLASESQTTSVRKVILSSLYLTDNGAVYQMALHKFIQVCDFPSSYCVDENSPLPSMHSLAVTCFNAVMKQILVQFTLSARDYILRQRNQIKHAQDYLLFVPRSGLDQCIGPRQFKAVVFYRLGIPMFVEDGLCSCCNKPMHIYGDHALHCAKDVGIKFRHDLVRDVTVDICFKAGVPARKEVSFSLVSENNKDLRPADILVLNWENGRDVCMDITGVSPFIGDGVRGFVTGQAISIAISRKLNKYLNECDSHGLGLGVLSFTTLGELSEDFVCFFKRLKNCLVSNDAGSGLGSFIFHRLGVVIQKRISAQLVARFPTKNSFA